MRVWDLLTSPWAIRPETLQVMLDVYDRHLRGEQPDLKAIEAALGRPLKNEPKDYFVQDGVAVLPIEGILAKRMDLFTQISGGTSTVRLQQQLRQALDDPAVHSIVLLVDSPGGEVDGTQALARDIFDARKEKPIVALGDGVMASGAYWIASAAPRVFIASDTTVGSIGVVATHTDISKAQEMRGVKTTEITAGRYKRIASNFAPLSQEGRQSIQDIVDHVYSIFVDDVARNRSVSSPVVLDKMADGRLFLGKQAVSAGLVDGFATLDKLVALLNAERRAPALQAAAPKQGFGFYTPEHLEALKSMPAVLPPGARTVPALLEPAAPAPVETDPREAAEAARRIQTELRARRIEVPIEECVTLAMIEAGSAPLPADPVERAQVVARFADVYRAREAEQGREVFLEQALAEVSKRFGVSV